MSPSRKSKRASLRRAQVVRVPDEARIPLEEGLYPPESPAAVRLPDARSGQGTSPGRESSGIPHGRPRSVDRRSDGGVADVRAEPLDVEGIVQERVAGIARVVGDVEDGVHAKDVRQHEEVQVQRVVPDHEPVVRQPAQRLRLLRDLDPLRASIAIREAKRWATEHVPQILDRNDGTATIRLPLTAVVKNRR